ncbi:MAG: glycosyltransferase family 39 protein [Anaerolineae bacterium]
MRFSELGTFPNGCQSDECNNGLDALKWLAGARYMPYAETNEGQATLFTHLIALSFRLFGVGVTQMRVVSALVGVLTVAAFYLLARDLFGRRVALAATALLATSRWHVTFSRIVYELIMQPGVMILLTLFLLRALRTGKRWQWALAGVMLALGLNTYTAFRVVPVIVAAFLLFWIAREWIIGRSRPGSGPSAAQRPAETSAIRIRYASSAVAPPPSDIRCTPSAVASPPSDIRCTPSAVVSPPSDIRCAPSAVASPPSDIRCTPSAVASPPSDIRCTPSAVASPPSDIRCTPSAVVSPLRHDLQGIALFFGAAFTAILPLGVYIVQNWAVFTGRMRHISILNDVERLGSVQPIVENFKKTLYMFNWRGDEAALNNLPGAPMLDTLVAILFVLGLVYALWYTLRARPLPVLYTLWFVGILSLGVLSVAHEAPTARRTIGMIPLVYLLVALVVDQFFRIWRTAWRDKGVRVANLAVAALVTVAMVANARVYFQVQAEDPTVWSAYSPSEFSHRAFSDHPAGRGHGTDHATVRAPLGHPADRPRPPLPGAQSGGRCALSWAGRAGPDLPAGAGGPAAALPVAADLPGWRGGRTSGPLRPEPFPLLSCAGRGVSRDAGADGPVLQHLSPYDGGQCAASYGGAGFGPDPGAAASALLCVVGGHAAGAGLWPIPL